MNALSELDSFIGKHRKSEAFLDANLLVLHLIGLTAIHLVRQCPHPKGYAEDDYRLLDRFVAQFARIVTTPHVAAEVNSLAGKLPSAKLPDLRRIFRDRLEVMEEATCTSRTAAAHPLFQRFGLTDAAIGCIASQGLLVATDDLPLYQALRHRGVDAVNFTHLRTANWAH